MPPVPLVLVTSNPLRPGTAKILDAIALWIRTLDDGFMFYFIFDGGGGGQIMI